MTKHLFTLGAGFLLALFIVAWARPGVLPWTERRADIIRAEAEASRIAAAADLDRIRATVEAEERRALVDMAMKAGRVPVILLVVMGAVVLVLSGLLAVVLVLWTRRESHPRPVPVAGAVTNHFHGAVDRIDFRESVSRDTEYMHQGAGHDMPYAGFYPPMVDGWGAA